MRVLLIAHVPTNEASAKMFRENPKKVAEGLETYMKQVHAEAAYFGEDNGQRTAYFVVDLPSADMIPTIAEPLFLNLGAKVNIKPVMTIDQVNSGLSKITV